MFYVTFRLIILLLNHQTPIFLEFLEAKKLMRISPDLYTYIRSVRTEEHFQGIDIPWMVWYMEGHKTVRTRPSPLHENYYKQNV